MREWIGSGPKAENSGQKTFLCFSVPERGDVQLGNAIGQHEHALAGRNAELTRARWRTRSSAPPERAVAEILHCTGLCDPAQRDGIAAAVQHVPVDRLVGDVETAAVGQPVEQCARGRPAERAQVSA